MLFFKRLPKFNFYVLVGIPSQLHLLPFPVNVTCKRRGFEHNHVLSSVFDRFYRQAVVQGQLKYGSSKSLTG